MQIASCRIKLNKGHDVAGVRITPAEVLVLRRLHKANVGTDPVIELQVLGSVDRSPALEVRRLMGKYSARNKKGEPIVTEMFPGVNPTLPETFDEVWPDKSAEAQTAADSTKLKFDEPIVPLNSEAEEVQSLQTT